MDLLLVIVMIWIVRSRHCLRGKTVLPSTHNYWKVIIYLSNYRRSREFLTLSSCISKMQNKIKVNILNLKLLRILFIKYDIRRIKHCTLVVAWEIWNVNTFFSKVILLVKYNNRVNSCSFHTGYMNRMSLFNSGLYPWVITY